MNDLLKKRMAASREASDLTAGEVAYQHIFQNDQASVASVTKVLPLEALVPFFTADIGFRPYPEAKLKAFAEQLREEGLLVHIIVRPIPGRKQYEILAGHNRVNAAKLALWKEIPSEVVEADDARAIVIATSTNLIQRQRISIVEQGKAYKALLDAKNRNGQHNIDEQTFGDNRQRYNVRKLVAEFFGVTEYEVRKTVKLTRLRQELLDILETKPKQINLACADMIADYDAESQDPFLEICTSKDYRINKAAMKHIQQMCPPPHASSQNILSAWREARSQEDKRKSAPSSHITFRRERFAPYIEKIGGDDQLEELFLEFLHTKIAMAQV